MQSRSAIAVALLCVTILLASACGYGNSAPVQPPRLAQEFLLWEPGVGPSSRVVGYGYSSGLLDNISATVHLFEPPCELSEEVRLSGRTFPGAARTETINLASSPPGVALVATAVKFRSNHWELAYPMSFSVPADPNCPRPAAIEAQAREGPRLKRSWFGRLETARMTLRLSQADPAPDGSSTIWGEVRVPQNPCLRLAEFFHDRRPLPGPQLTTETLRISADSTVTFEGLPALLDPDPPATLNLKFQFHGGACDGQTASVTVSH